jgi:hypothetical protein
MSAYRPVSGWEGLVVRQSEFHVYQQQILGCRLPDKFRSNGRTTTDAMLRPPSLCPWVELRVRHRVTFLGGRVFLEVATQDPVRMGTTM